MLFSISPSLSRSCILKHKNISAQTDWPCYKPWRQQIWIKHSNFVQQIVARNENNLYLCDEVYTQSLDLPEFKGLQSTCPDRWGCARKYWEMLDDPKSRSPVLEHTLNHPTTNKFVAWSSEWKMCDLNFI